MDPTLELTVSRLLTAKAHTGTTVSVCIPARNEAATIGRIVEDVADLAMRGLVDEVIVMDDDSSDSTAAEAAAAGADVVSVARVLPDTGRGRGKGEVLWKSLWCSAGDVVCWVDADITNFGPHFVVRLVEPLLADPAIGFAKGHYRRPVGEDPLGGGRVTELVARPLVSRFFPELAHFPQPLSGEFAGRRDVLEAVPFVQGWGVDLGLVIDIAALVGTDAMVPVDLGTRIHRNRALRDLGPQALAIQSMVLSRAGKTRRDPGVGGATEMLLRPAADGSGIEEIPVQVGERPPIVTIAGYESRPALQRVL